MLQKTMSILTAVSLFAGMALPAFAQTTSTSTASSTQMAAESNFSTANRIQCVGKAVTAREVSTDAAMTMYTNGVTAAYAARGAALKQAYTLTTTPAVKEAATTAWSTFNASMKATRKNWQAARNASWATYRSAILVCKAPAGVSDSANSVYEATGN